MGTVQAGIAHGVLDAVRAGDIPKEKVNDLGIIYSVWLDPVVLKCRWVKSITLGYSASTARRRPRSYARPCVASRASIGCSPIRITSPTTFTSLASKANSEPGPAKRAKQCLAT